ncbi:DNA-directed RNA polymerase II core subunit rpo21 [Coniosporium apollinis]|uniref:DNA-directed RNA polymerase II core subunit rpo21 n=2 Tax=Coniosporium TaxID=2810619 RepID=A0ABQ9P3W1_9PEZI|nr:DNA-directed RNA polymerase II core subunit rpo21 [Cladosporium sp. JES 115]KAJ9669286.1 DNA-directed RNA polymerase II core subunit rpo21 [Coniosporium apollinis]
MNNTSSGDLAARLAPFREAVTSRAQHQPCEVIFVPSSPIPSTATLGPSSPASPTPTTRLSAPDDRLPFRYVYAPPSPVRQYATAPTGHLAEPGTYSPPARIHAAISDVCAVLTDILANLSKGFANLSKVFTDLPEVLADLSVRDATLSELFAAQLAAPVAYADNLAMQPDVFAMLSVRDVHQASAHCHCSTGEYRAGAGPTDATHQ